MKIHLGARVECRGERVGTVKRVVLDQTSFDVRQIVIALGGLIVSREVVVPAAQIYDANDEAITLDLSAEEAAALPDVDDAPPVPADGDEGELGGLGALGPLSHMEPAIGAVYVAPELAAREISAGTPVYAGGEKIGEISEVIFDASDKAATAFVVERGALFTRRFEIPADWVSAIEDDRVLLNRTREQVDQVGQGPAAGGPPAGGEVAV